MKINTKKIINKKITNIIEGKFTKKDEISPAYISNINPQNIEIDNIYYSGIIIVNYNWFNFKKNNRHKYKYEYFNFLWKTRQL